MQGLGGWGSPGGGRRPQGPEGGSGCRPAFLLPAWPRAVQVREALVCRRSPLSLMCVAAPGYPGHCVLRPVFGCCHVILSEIWGNDSAYREEGFPLMSKPVRGRRAGFSPADISPVQTGLARLTQRRQRLQLGLQALADAGSSDAGGFVWRHRLSSAPGTLGCVRPLPGREAAPRGAGGLNHCGCAGPSLALIRTRSSLHWGRFLGLAQVLAT